MIRPWLVRSTEYRFVVDLAIPILLLYFVSVVFALVVVNACLSNLYKKYFPVVHYFVSPPPPMMMMTNTFYYYDDRIAYHK